MFGDISVFVSRRRTVRGNVRGAERGIVDAVVEGLPDKERLGIVVKRGGLLRSVKAEEEGVTVDELLEAHVGPESILRKGITVEF